VDVNFAKKNFGFIVAGAQIGSILGPTVATQAETIGIPMLYMGGSFCMVFMVIAMFFYVQKFGVNENDDTSKDSKSEGGIMEGFVLFYKHDYVKGIFCVSSLFMIQFTVFDYMMKVLTNPINND
jgi:AAA family ATP:ADP antiporter